MSEIAQIVCMGVPTDPVCSEEATSMVILHGGAAGIHCERHLQMRVDEVMAMGHGSCRVERLTEADHDRHSQYSKWADQFRGKLSPLPKGRYFGKHKRRR